jgi:hypothetical protein
LQEWPYNAWSAATGSNITLADVQRGEAIALPKLDEGFFAVRYRRCTPAEKRYLRAIAITVNAVKTDKIVTPPARGYRVFFCWAQAIYMPETRPDLQRASLHAEREIFSFEGLTRGRML